MTQMRMQGGTGKESSVTGYLTRGQLQRWIRRHSMAAGFVLWILVTVSLHLVWSWRMNQRLAAQSEVIRQRDEPWDSSELVIRSVSPEEDGFPLLMRAVAADSGVSPYNTNYIYPHYPPYGDRWEKAAAASEVTNGVVFDLVRQVRSYPRAQPRVAWPKTLLSIIGNFPFGPVRQVSNTLADGALYKQHLGNELEAVQRLRDGVHISKLLTEDDTQVGQLISFGTYELFTRHANVIAPRLEFNVPQLRVECLKLIQELLDDGRIQGQFAKSFAIERIFNAEILRFLSEGTVVLKPLANQEIAEQNRIFEVFATAAKADNMEVVLRVIADHRLKPSGKGIDLNNYFGSPAPARDIPEYADWYAGDDVVKGMQLSFERRFQSLGERRSSAIILAARLYRLDHGNRWPQRLDELVPAYLDKVPADPFHEDNRPMGYVILRGGLPDGSDRPLVYFDAGNIVDGAIDSEPMVSWFSPNGGGRESPSMRQYRDLAAWSPTVRKIDQMIKEQEDMEAMQKKSQEEYEAKEKQFQKEERERLEKDLKALPEE